MLNADGKQQCEVWYPADLLAEHDRIPRKWLLASYQHKLPHTGEVVLECLRCKAKLGFTNPSIACLLVHRPSTACQSKAQVERGLLEEVLHRSPSRVRQCAPGLRVAADQSCKWSCTAASRPSLHTAQPAPPHHNQHHGPVSPHQLVPSCQSNYYTNIDIRYHE